MNYKVLPYHKERQDFIIRIKTLSIIKYYQEIFLIYTKENSLPFKKIFNFNVAPMKFPYSTTQHFLKSRRSAS